LSPDRGFTLFLVLTVLLLGGVVASGLRGRLRLHLPLVAAALVSLGVTIAFAKRLGELYDLASAGWITPVHLTVAKLTTAAYLLPIATGVMTLRDRRHKPWHLRCAIAVLAMTLVTTGLGLWMILAAERLG
jgi:hypothetical protein